MNTADILQLGLLIVAVVVMYSAIAKERKKADANEVKRDLKIDTMSKDITEIRKELKNHRHHTYEASFAEWEGRCQLREQHIDQIVHNLGIRVNDHLEIIKELKKAVEPIQRIEAGVDKMSALLSEKLGYLKADHNKLEGRVHEIEKHNKG